jgi:hypothetical protein
MWREPGNDEENEKRHKTMREKGWDTHVFNTLKEAQEYAKQWLDYYAPEFDLELNTPYEYSSCDPDEPGDVIEIREVE